MLKRIFTLTAFCLVFWQVKAVATKVYQKVEVEFVAEYHYDNPYKQVEIWVNLQGPDFNKKVYGFYDGLNSSGKAIYKVRMVALSPGEWQWTSDANVHDPGLINQSGSFTATAWTELEKQENPNRRGFLKIHDNKRVMQYADGTAFFLIGDTYWSSSTWRVPYSDLPPRPDFITTPKDGTTFQEMILNRKKYGFNCIAMVAAFPNWIDDDHPTTVMFDNDSIQIRNGWHRPGSKKIAHMEDEEGNMPFEIPGPCEPSVSCANLDRINPAYFQNLDNKMAYLHDQGFVPFLETIRRDLGPHLAHYYDEKETLSRFINYLRARYNCYNVIFSAVHTDTFTGDYTGRWSHDQWADFWRGITDFAYQKYGLPPFGQIYTALGPKRTDVDYQNAEWLMVHNGGNERRNNYDVEFIYDMYQKADRPVFMSEGYYVGWKLYDKYVEPGVEKRGSIYDNYLGRVHHWSCIFNGGIPGGIFGTGAYAGGRRIEGEINYNGIYIDQALNYEAGKQMEHLKSLVTYTEDKWDDLQVRREDISPRTSSYYSEKSLYGLASLLKTKDNELVLAHFQGYCARNPEIRNLKSGIYQVSWFNPRSGAFQKLKKVKLQQGSYKIPDFPDLNTHPEHDWVFIMEFNQDKRASR
ncbi:MAG: apiosidase-like domain-containing protein [Candidatus Cyclobacteriaceae bacterium M3_2C_046]